MKAVVFDGELKFDENYMKPERKENEALIKPLLLGVCNTDEEITKGYMGYNGVLNMSLLVLLLIQMIKV